MPDQKPMRTRCLGGFSIMWVTKLLISLVKIRIFCPRTTKFGPNLAFLFILGQALLAHLVPCWWVSWWLWRAVCISQDTYLLFLWIGNQKKPMTGKWWHWHHYPYHKAKMMILPVQNNQNSEWDANANDIVLKFWHFCFSLVLIPILYLSWLTRIGGK